MKIPTYKINRMINLYPAGSDAPRECESVIGLLVDLYRQLMRIDGLSRKSIEANVVVFQEYLRCGDYNCFIEIAHQLLGVVFVGTRPIDHVDSDHYRVPRGKDNDKEKEAAD